MGFHERVAMPPGSWLRVTQALVALVLQWPEESIPKSVHWETKNRILSSSSDLINSNAHSLTVSLHMLFPLPRNQYLTARSGASRLLSVAAQGQRAALSPRNGSKMALWAD